MSEILREGRNCWKLARADRLAFLIDAAAFYSAFADALERASRSVMILCWDFDARVRLRRDGRGSPGIGELLEAAVRARPELEIHVLEWDFTLLYTFGGESRPIFSRSRPSHSRIHLHADDSHPTGGSHHQKVIVVDDQVAFVGGLDFTTGRWDTPEHRPDDPRRVGPSGESHGPFHDVQVVLSGPAAALLGDLARDRWWRARGERLAPVVVDGDPWPEGLEADIQNARVAIARTEPRSPPEVEVREVEELYLTSIAAARRWIYIESQYLTSAAVADAISRRLDESDGPEVVVVLPRDSSGWLEQGTMDVLRARVLRRLRSLPGNRRLRVYYPVVRHDAEQTPIYVHSKVMVIDDALVRVGSSNISNRSMGLDTECDLAVEAGDDALLQAMVAGLRQRLLAEHLGVGAERVRAVEEETGSLIETVERLRGGARTLVPLTHEPPEWLMEALPDRDVVDPERPVDLERWIDRQVPRGVKRMAGRRLLGLAGMAVLAGLVTAALTLTPQGRWLGPERIAEVLPITRGLAGPVVVIAAFLMGSVFLVPVTLLTLATVLIYTPMPGVLYAALGLTVGAAATYGLGRWLNPDTVRRIGGSHLNRISAELARKGFLGMLTLRLLPLASFSLIGYVAGAARVRFGDYALSTTVGLAPLLLAVVLFTDRLEAAIVEPSVVNLALLILVVCGIAAASFVFGRWLRRHGERDRGTGA